MIALVTALINAVWQPALIAGITWFALRISRCTNATTRHAVWTVALVASFCVPILSATSLVLPQAPVQQATSLPAARPTIRHAAIKPPSLPASTPSLPAVYRPKITVRPTVAQVVAEIWAVIAALILGRLAFSFFYLERLKRDALPLSLDRRHELTRWDRAEKGQRDVRICVSDEIRVPVAVGIFDAMILLPHDLVDELDSTDLDRVLLHELAHVRRSDDWVNLLERIGMALLFFSPGIYFIARQMDLEREVACDDWVLAQAAENASYARCLARIVEMTQWPYRPLAAPGVFVTRRSMSIRIERLLARGRDVRVRLAVVPSLISLVAIVAIVIAGGFVSPTIAYTMSSDVTVPALKLKPVAVAAKPSPHAATAPKTAPKAAPTATPTPLVAAYVPAKPATHTAVHTHVAVHEHASMHVAQAFPAQVAASPPASLDNAVADTGYLDELRAAGLTNLDAETVIALKSVGVTGDYIRQMREAGLGQLNARDLITLKSVGVTPDYIKTMRAAGLGATDARGWTEIKSLGLTPDYVSQMRAAGLNENDARRWAELKSVGLTPDYVSSMRSAGLGASDGRGWMELKSVGVTPDYASELQRAGITGLDSRTLVELKSMGVTPAYVQDLAGAGYPRLSAREYGELKSLGVDGAYIQRLAQHGFTKLPIHKLIEFKSMGIEPQ